MHMNVIYKFKFQIIFLIICLKSMQYVIQLQKIDINYLIKASLIIDPLLTGMKREWEKGRNRRERKEKEEVWGR